MAKAHVLYITEERRLRKKKISYLGEWLFDGKLQRAWFTLREFFVDFQGHNTLPIDERWANPRSPYRSGKYPKEKELEQRTNPDKRISQAVEIWKNKADREGRRNIIVWGITICTCGVVSLFCLIIILLVSGRLQF